MNANTATPTRTTNNNPKTGDVYHFFTGAGAAKEAGFLARTHNVKATKIAFGEMAGAFTFTVKKASQVTNWDVWAD